ncbi:MAG: hypothetical protein GX620_05390 [Chloroflexi bacterium]|nr:hypothetical protein [Chloroflexota bacterium]
MKRSGVIPRRDLDWQAIAILFLAAMLLLFDLGGRSLWWDEIINVYIERQSIRGIFASLSGKPGFYQDIHPPLYHLMMHAWITLVSTSNLAMRLPSALFGLLSVALTYRVGHRLGGRSLARSAAYLMAMSAGGLMYLRMGRYYAMTCALGLLSTWLFLRVWTLPRLSNWLLYSAVALAMYYTDYLVVTVLATHTLYALWSGWKHRRAIVVRLAIMQVVVGLLFTPWLPSMFAQVGWAGKVAQADLAFSPAGYLMKIVFPFLSFTAGETLFPWEIPAIASYAAFGLMLILGITQNPLAREHFLLLLLLVSIPLLGTITVISILLPTIPFIGVPNRTLFALPYFSMLAASG